MGYRAGVAMYRFVLTAVVHTYRSIVDEADIHHSLEHAIFDFVFSIELADLANERVVELLAFGCWSRLVEVWFVALLCRCE